MPRIVIVNASHVLTDAEVQAVVAPLQKADDTLLRPAWNLDPATYEFMPWQAFPWPEYRSAPEEMWPLFVNNHSTDPGALGWHTDQAQLDRVFGRVFAGDCVRYGISWTVDLSHEAFEMRVDPRTDRVQVLPDGRTALMESCDPVEDDLQAIDVDGVKITNFVLPSYFNQGPRPWDYGQRLTGPCPTLTAGGYQELLVNGQWTQVTAMHLGGPASYRSQRFHRSERARRLRR